MEKLSKSTKQQLWKDMDYLDGRKVFGELETFVQTTTETDHIPISDVPSTLSVIMPTMERPDKTLETMDSLDIAAKNAGISTEIVVVDNSFTPHLHGILDDKYSRMPDRESGLTGITYHFDPRLTFPMARNVGINLSSETSDFVGSWDSDIHCGRDALKVLFSEWSQHPQYIGMAPALANYDGLLEEYLAQDNFRDVQNNPHTRAQLSMPGALGDKIGRRDGDVIRSTMMRGAYFMKKNAIPEIAIKHPANDFYARDFIVWSNVPTCMSANELEKHMGYVIHPEGLAFHKEGSDGVSMGHDIPQRISENLKSLCMLFYRNRVFPGSPEEEQHDLLISFNTDAIAKLMRTDRDSASEIVNNLEVLAQAIDGIGDAETFNDFANDFCPYANELIRPYVADLGARISHREVYGRIKQLHMLSPNARSYQLST